MAGGRADRRPGGRLAFATRLVALAALVLACPPVRPSALNAQSARLTQDEALRLAFPAPLTVERRTAFLSEAERRQAAARAGKDVEPPARVITYYVARRDGAPVGVAYFDSHRVRTLPEVVMIVVGPDARIGRVEVLRFQEPPEYEAPESWLAQLRGKGLDERLSLKGGVVNMSGATLTSQALVRASRRVLAIHEVIRPFRRQAGSGE